MAEQQSTPKPRPPWQRFLGYSMLPVPLRRRVGLGLLVLRGPVRRHAPLDDALAIRLNEAKLKGCRVRFRSCRRPFGRTHHG